MHIYNIYIYIFVYIGLSSAPPLGRPRVISLRTLAKEGGVFRARPVSLPRCSLRSPRGPGTPGRFTRSGEFHLRG